MRFSPLGLLLLATVALLPACEAGIDPIDVDPRCPKQPLRGPEQWPPASLESVIDDFEDGNLLTARVGERMGSWYSYPVASPVATGEASNLCAARGKFAGHFTVEAAPTPGDTGTNWNATMIDPFSSIIPYDASQWSGFSFWIAAGDMPDGAATEMSVGINTTDVLATGTDYHAKNGIPLTRSWTRWSIRFDELEQRTGGAPMTFRKDHVVNFIFWPRNPFDFWIDDFRFEP
jgi:hypothetical protein